MTYQTPQFMADLLEKVQALQLTVLKLNDGHSLHVDTQCNEDHLYGNGTGFHTGFDVTLFYCTDLVHSWYFSPLDDADALDHTLKDLAFKINRL